MKPHIRPIVSAIAVALAGTSAAIEAKTSDVEAIQQQVRQLQSTVDALERKIETGKGHGNGHTSGGVSSASEFDPETSGGHPATQDDIRGLKSDLENFKYQYNREREYNTTQSTRPVLISGFIQARFGTNSVPNGNNLLVDNINSNNRNNSFSDGIGALQFNGLLYKDYEEGKNLAYTFRIGANASQANSTNTNSNVYVQFANISYNFLPTLSPEDPRLVGILGQQQTLFGLDAAAPDELRPTINPAQYVGGLGIGIDIGAVFKGEYKINYDYGYSYRAPLLQYILGVVNGSGPNRVDNNNEKDYLGRIVFTVPSEYNSWLRQLAFGASYYKGTQNTSYSNAGTTLSGTGPRDRYGFDVYYNHDPFGFTFEYAKGNTGYTFGSTAAKPGYEEIEAEDYVFTAYYTIGPQFLYANSSLGTTSVSIGRFDDFWPKSYQFFARYDKWDPAIGENNKVNGYQQDITTLGLNVFFAQTTKFQLNYNYVDNKEPGREIDHQVLAQFQFGF